MFTFDHINHYSHLIDENEFFKQYFNPLLPGRYNSNFFLLSYQPSLAEFELIEEMQLTFHEDEGLQHLKFFWPQDKGFTPEIVSYFEQEGYEIEMLELLEIDPRDFKGSPVSSIEVITIDQTTLDDFKRLNYPQDLNYGTAFAETKQQLFDMVLDDQNSHLLLAYIDGVPAGSLIAIVGSKHIEIDDLFVKESFRHQGVATKLQSAVMQLAIQQEKHVILVADGDDTPKNMYLKQGYQQSGYQLAAQKRLDNQEA
ncbi:GNAT family N-acetyltransferase [Marinilactibacillus kalidii]|uniref:GNAT family N-acetyltransferase n=1 Tax=Marinilactibacillus kalidii TaxID=2820274 RepID=UPI001ABDBA84|nr:GNAT family N-acetyltransferase [Marinilactibacillus kalidii]